MDALIVWSVYKDFARFYIQLTIGGGGEGDAAMDVKTKKFYLIGP